MQITILKKNINKMNLNLEEKDKYYNEKFEKLMKKIDENENNVKKLENIIKTERNERKREQEFMKKKIKKLEKINKELRVKIQRIRKIFLLVDIRHEPSENDKMMYDWIVATCFEPVVIATKADKIKRSQLQKQLKTVREGLGMTKEGTLIAFSAETKQGLEEIYAQLEADLGRQEQ